MTEALLLGAVAYDPKVVRIWNGFRTWLRNHDLPFDYVLYSHYERQVEDLIAGRIDLAWNSPLAWVRAHRICPDARALAMRDTDCDLTSVLVVRADSPAVTPSDLSGSTIGVGAVDSPQATLLPQALFDGVAVNLRRFDIGVGLHGDHIGGERDAALALVEGEIEAACMSDSSCLLFATDGTVSPGTFRVIAQTAPFDHCNMTCIGPPTLAVDRFTKLLLDMDYADPLVRPLLDLEGLTRWVPGRTGGYDQLERAVDRLHFYDDRGNIVAGDYRP